MAEPEHLASEEDHTSDGKFPGLGAIAIIGWFIVAGVAYGLALNFHWDALTQPPKPLIVLLVGIPYWLLVNLIWLVLVNYRPRQETGLERPGSLRWVRTRLARTRGNILQRRHRRLL